MAITGRIHSFQSLGAVDGPGIRFVVFLQGCPLRCACCHNPDTWDAAGGEEYTPDEILKKILRYRSYFGKTGGVTVSGGEPLLQEKFVRELFRLCRENGIHTCLDTSGCFPERREVLEFCDHVLLDIKMTDPQEYFSFCGCPMEKPLAFLELLEERGIDTWIRQVIIPGKNDSEENICRLNRLLEGKSCVKKVELLPFRKLCLEKYESLGLPFPLKDTPEASPDLIRRLSSLLR